MEFPVRVQKDISCFAFTPSHQHCLHFNLFDFVVDVDDEDVVNVIW